MFRRFTVASYVANFDGYDGEKFEILPQARMVGGDEIVETQHHPGGDSPTGSTT